MNTRRVYPLGRVFGFRFAHGFLALCLALVFASSACQPDDPTKTCTDNGDCATGERCVQQTCRKISIVNEAPVARIDGPTEGRVNEAVTLDGSKSSDPEGSDLTYAWKLDRQPDESQASLDDSTAKSVSFTPDRGGDYIVTLTVKDDRGLESSLASYKVTVTGREGNSAPIADAGQDRFGAADSESELDGSKSSDPDNDPLTYKWTIVSKPNGSAAELDDDTAEKPKVKFDKVGKYIFELVVSDGVDKSAADSVTIEILDDFDLKPTTEKLSPASGYVGGTVEVTITGKGFSTRALVLFDGASLTATDVTIKSATEIVAKLSLAGLSAKKYPVVIRNPNGEESAPLDFEVIDPPTPTLDAVTPPSGLEGSKLTITVTGTNFVADSKVLFNLLPMPTTYKDDKTLEAELDLTQTPPGDYEIKVQNPGGKSSGGKPFKVNTDGGFAPVLQVLNPSQGTVGTKLPFSVHGSSFAAGAVIIFDGKEIPSIRQSRDTIEADPELDLTSIPVGKYDVWVRNANGKESAKEVFEVIEKDPAPKLDRILPPTIYINDLTKIDVYGNFFTPDIKLYIGTKVYSGNDLGSLSATYFTVTVDTSQGGWSLGNVNAYIENAKGKKSGTFALTITNKPSSPAPLIDRFSPTSGTVGVDIADFRIYGRDFCPGSSTCAAPPIITIKNSSGTDIQASTKVFTITSTVLQGSSSYIKGSLAVSKMPKGSYTFQLEHPTNKQKSNTKSFTVSTPQPLRLDYVYPYFAKSGSVVKCDLNGGPFTSSSYVMVGTDKINLLSGTSKTRRSFNFDAKTKYSQTKNYDIKVCNSPTVCSTVFAYPVQPATGTTPFITAARGSTYPLYTNATVTFNVYGYRWVNALTAVFFIDGKELTAANFPHTSKTCKQGSTATSSSNCQFKGFSTKGLTVGKHTIQVKWGATSSILYDFYVEAP